VAALSLILFNWRELNILKSHIDIRNIVNGIVLIFCMYGLMYVVLRWATNFESTYQIGINISAFILILYGIKKLYQKKDNTVLTCLLFIIPAVLFSTLHYLSPLIITLFLKRNIDAQVYGFLISPQWFQLAGTLAIVIGGPIVIFVFNFLRKRQITINTSLQFSLALILMGSSFVMMSYGIKHFTNGFSININWLIAGNLIQGIAELLLAPIGFSMIARIAPTCSRGTMMGVWLLLLSLGAIFSGYLSNSITDIKYAFSILAIVPILCGSIIFLLRYKLTK
jgi:POT family proton-dependent oligopeptide transporter